MSKELPTLHEFEEMAALTQETADKRHGNHDKRLRNRRSRRVARKALAYAVGGAVAVWGGGELMDKGFNQIERDIQADSPSGQTVPNSPENVVSNSGRDIDDHIRRIVNREQ